MSQFKMVDVGEKAVTRRRALARGRFRAKQETIERIWAGDLPKGDALRLAEVAGVMAAKRTSDLLPLCHPLILDTVRVGFKAVQSQAGEPEIEATCEVVCHGKTGVEMEALTGVQMALLCVYDLAKAIDPVLEISGVHLAEKDGGKSGQWRNPTPSLSSVPQQLSPPERVFEGIRACVLTVSDRGAKGEFVDRTGPLLAEALSQGGAIEVSREIVPDEIELIRSCVRTWIEQKKPHAIILTGGTGISPRDVTPEALGPLWESRLPGFGERLRSIGAGSTPMAWISRAEAGVISGSLVFALPGSPGAVSDALIILKDSLRHSLEMRAGGKGHHS